LTQPRSSVILAAGFGKPSKAAAVEAKRGCACGSGKLYKDCCKPYHVSAESSKFELKPRDAEACLRARFSAYCIKAPPDIIVATTAADTAARKGSVSEDGKVKSTFEQDVKVRRCVCRLAMFCGAAGGSTYVASHDVRTRLQVTMSWMEFKGLRILGSKSPSPDTTVFDIEYSVKKVW
jgi:hypothetical protein